MAEKSLNKVENAIKSGLAKIGRKLRLRRKAMKDQNQNPPSAPETQNGGQNSQPLAGATASPDNQADNGVAPQATRSRGRSTTTRPRALSNAVSAGSGQGAQQDSDSSEWSDIIL